MRFLDEDLNNTAEPHSKLDTIVMSIEMKKEPRNTSLDICH